MNCEQFKALAKSPEFQNLASIAIFKRAKAEVTRERVDAYVLPVFNRFEFFVADKWQRTGKAGQRITEPGKLCLCEDETGCAQFYAACDAEHRFQGYTDLKPGYCPALVAEAEQCQAEGALLKFAGQAFGAPLEKLYCEKRKRCLDLLFGAAANERGNGRKAVAA